MDRLKKIEMNLSSSEIGSISTRLWVSYALDWLVILASVGVATGISDVTPNMRPFSLVDPNISFPFTEHEKVPVVMLGLIVILVPALLISLICLFFVPGPTVDRHTPRALVWRRKLWEWNTGWMGLAMALATAYLITNGMKNLFGKPRPDLLSRCNADLDRIADHVVGGYGDRVRRGIVLVSHTICKNREILDDGFRSFPSGHASSSWAGMTYLTLFLCSKFAIAIPFLVPHPPHRQTAASAFQHGAFRGLHRRHRRGSGSYANVTLALHPDRPGSSHDEMDDSTYPIRNRAAAPPTYLLVLALIPIATAMYISSTRFSDFRHHGFDILFGSLLGFASAWFAFRWYHLPIRQGAGWAWGPRSQDRAFGVGVGVSGYAADDIASHDDHARREMHSGHEDLELGQTEAPLTTLAAGIEHPHSPAPIASHPGLSRPRSALGTSDTRYI